MSLVSANWFQGSAAVPEGSWFSIRSGLPIWAKQRATGWSPTGAWWGHRRSSMEECKGQTARWPQRKRSAWWGKIPTLACVGYHQQFENNFTIRLPQDRSVLGFEGGSRWWSCLRYSCFPLYCYCHARCIRRVSVLLALRGDGRFYQDPVNDPQQRLRSRSIERQRCSQGSGVSMVLNPKSSALR